MSAEPAPWRAAIAALAGLALTCSAPTPTEPTSTDDEVVRDRVDVHVHLVGGAVDELLAALDRQAIAAAVVIASPHLDPALGREPGRDARLRGWREANEALLAATADHRDRLFPFITVEPAEVGIAELERWFQRGARGVKLYAGHQELHARPLDDPAHASLFEWLEHHSVPVLAHVNTVRYRDELARLLRAHPRLELVCAHLCGSRTDLDRLAGLLREFPRLRVDTSHGAGLPGVDGFTAIETDRDRLRALIEVQPERFLFGSDLVTTRAPGHEADAAREWDLQLSANLGLLERERFEFWRHTARIGAFTPGVYHGLALADPAVSRVLGGNARAWLGAYGRE
ncbi:amidohydrolase family protein [Nannocystis sp. SCPEA4]|uniref:amidohydrolase family protein n=1 Tax=Nannocystis sp. SCPEA4 TaxID=2996787 RepID=UPI0022714B61|nr:amidohydrolase family protein [Nannocystis sp. SCPEA4]